ncbi:polyketide synthase [Planomonospora sphaerica]|uniref:Polyketide synthase n=1 Tax=Planomonospora sphaerica TaxID=161355 RepID=A0A161LPB5_9ACTN|nr:polyketide synthase [Planomonospora sphaerica]
MVAVRLDVRVLAGAGAGLPSVFAGLVPVARRRAAGGGGGAGGLGRRLAGLGAQEREAALLELVRTHVAGILGHAGPEAVEPEMAFKELGFDSLSAVEFRNRLNEVTGLRLPPTLVFDYPNAMVLAAHLGSELAPDPGAGNGHDSGEQRIRRILESIPLTKLRDAGLMDVLLELGGARSTESVSEADGTHGSIDDMDLESLINMALDGVDATDATQGA